ncbi:MAG: TolC family protein [Deltaproteobacteria bacterium]|jgi:outer membrane protein|nr:TolC family protein [Deltaproteobacteria bacterium]
MRAFFNTVALFLTVLILSYAVDVSAEVPAKSQTLDQDEIVNLVIERSFGIKQAEMGVAETKEGIPTAKSVFDTNLAMSGSYQYDNSKQTSSLFGDRTDTWLWNLSLSKEIPSGTRLGLSWANTRSQTFNAAVGGVQIIPSQALYEPILGVSLAQPLMQNAFGMNDRLGVKQAKLAYEASDSDLRRKIDLQVYQALRNYWSLVFVRKHIVAQKKAVRFARDFLSTTREERRLGTAEETDLLAARANLLNREDELMNLQEMERTTLESLRRDLEYDPDVFVQVTRKDPPFENPGMADDERINAAFERRGDYQALRKNLNRLNVRLKVAKNVRWPKLDLVSSLELNDIDPSYSRAVSDMDSPNVRVGLNFSIPLENRAARADTRRTTAEKAGALYALKDLENKILNEISRLVAEVGSRQRIVVTSRKVLELQVAKVREEMKNYHMGRSSSYVMVQYQNDAVSAERHLIESWLDYQNSVLGLWLADGSIVAGK